MASILLYSHLHFHFEFFSMNFLFIPSWRHRRKKVKGRLRQWFPTSSLCSNLQTGFGEHMHFQTLGHNFGDLTWLLVITWLLPLKLGKRSRISFFASLFASDYALSVFFLMLRQFMSLIYILFFFSLIWNRCFLFDSRNEPKHFILFQLTQCLQDPSMLVQMAKFHHLFMA